MSVCMSVDSAGEKTTKQISNKFAANLSARLIWAYNINAQHRFLKNVENKSPNWPKNGLNYI